MEAHANEMYPGIVGGGGGCLPTVHVQILKHCYSLSDVRHGKLKVYRTVGMAAMAVSSFTSEEISVVDINKNGGQT